MKRSKTILILCGALVAQGFILLFLNFFSTQNIKDRSTSKSLFKNFKPDQVTGMEIKDSINSFNIEKKGDQWFVNIEDQHLPGNKSKIESYLSALEQLNAGMIVYKGAEAEKLKDFGFDEENKQTISVMNSKGKNIQLHIGSIGPQRITSFVKLAEEDKIRQVASDISAQTGNEYIQWADRDLFKEISGKDIDKCILTADFEWSKDDYTIIQKDTTDDRVDFIVEGYPENKLDSYQVSSIVSQITSFMIDEYKLKGELKDQQESGKIEVILKNGKTYLLTFYAADSSDVGDFILKTDFNPFLYLNHRASIEHIFKPLESLFKVEEPAAQ